jgi:hypothetical protein
VIKIRYVDLPEGFHVEVRSNGAKRVIYLAPALSRAQRRAAIGRARQAAPVGRSASLPVVPLMFAIFADEIKTTVRSAIAAARVHPVGVTVPAGIVITVVVLYAFVTSVTVHLARPPQGFGSGPGHGRLPDVAAAAPSPAAQPPPGTGTAGAGAGGGRQGTARSGAPARQSVPSELAGSGGTVSPAPSSAGLLPSAPPSQPAQPSRLPSPVPSPLPSGSHCVQVGPVQVCVHLRGTSIE